MLITLLQPEIDQLVQFAPEVRRGLEQIVRAFDYARDLDCGLWEFAVEIERLIALGMTTSDLRWLVKRGYLSHACETTSPQDLARSFNPPEQNLAFAKATCFVISDAGLAILGRNLVRENPCIGGVADIGATETLSANHGNSVETAAQARAMTDPRISLPPRELSGHQCNGTAAVPNWDKDSRTFLVGENLVKRFRVPSPNQEAVLEAFQEEGWPVSIDDPLSPVPDQQPKRRLRDTIKCLNMNQATRLIRFRGDGTGQRVLWELVVESTSHVDSTAMKPLRRAA